MQGHLTARSLNYVQRWALQYYLRMEARERGEEKLEELKLQTFNLHPERWKQIYDQPAVTSLFGNQPEIPITDPRQLDHFYEGMRLANGGDVARLLGDVPLGTGRRV